MSAALETAAVTTTQPAHLSFRDFCDLIREDYSLYNDWTKPGFRAVALHRFGNWRLGLPRVIRFPLWIIYRFLYRWMRNHYGMDLSYSVRLGRRAMIPNQGNVIVHPHARIGDDCILRQNVTIGAGRSDRFDEAPVLGDRVEIGANAVIVGRVTIGDDARIGPNVAIFANVPPNTLVLAAQPRVIPLPAK